MCWHLDFNHKDYANEDGKMMPDEKGEFLKKYRASIITPEEEAKWKRGGCNGRYHYLGSVKTYSLIGKAFADSIVEITSQQGKKL